MAQQTQQKSTDTQKLRSLIESIEQILMCPVCLETIRNSFKLCLRGHVACFKCALRWPQCTLCKGPLTLQNPVSLRNIMQVMPRLCCYGANGCDKLLDSENCLKHEKFCGFRLIACRIPDCKLKMPLTEIVDHYRAKHLKAHILTEETQSVQTQIKNDEKFIKYTPVLLNGNKLFWLVEVNNVEKKEFKIYFHATPFVAITHDYYVQVMFEEENFKNSYTLKANVLENCEEELTWEYEKDQDKSGLLTEEYCVKIPLSQLDTIMKNSELAFKCRFFRK